MELNITEFFNTADPANYSASCAELGDNADRITWHNAMNADYSLLDTCEKVSAFKNYCRGFGAWDIDEINAWTTEEANALCIQFVAGDMREFEELAGGDWVKWGEMCEEGTCSHRIYGGPLTVDGQVYFYIGD